jgi:DNA polymerase I
MFPAYQSGREFAQELIEQLNVLPEFVGSLDLQPPKRQGSRRTTFSPPQSPLRSVKAALHWSRAAIGSLFSSPRRAVTILYPARGGEIARIGPEEVRERYGVDPKQVPDFIALRGDPSDKLPGAAGVGPKRAAQLLRQYGTLDGILEAGLFQTQADMLRLYRLIATMDAKAPLHSLDDQQPTWRPASTFARDWGLNQLADRLDEMA